MSNLNDFNFFLKYSNLFEMNEKENSKIQVSPCVLISENQYNTSLYSGKGLSPSMQNEIMLDSIQHSQQTQYQ